MRRELSRRDFLKLTSVGAAALALPWALEGCAEEEQAVRFFSSSERATLAAAAERILPPIDGVGPGEARAVDYIERMLTAFDYDPPLIFAGGPFSGRHPYPDNRTGRPSHDYPVDSFQHFLPLSRAKEIGWRVRLFGSQNVEGGDFNDAVLGPTVGIRQRYAEGLKSIDAASDGLFGKTFSALTAGQQDEALLQADGEFILFFAEHIVEGMYGDPAYGGNHDRSGWRSVRFDGDSQPLGFSIYDGSSGSYRERAEAPMSTANPDEDFAGFDDDVLELVGNIAMGTGGTRFF